MTRQEIIKEYRRLTGRNPHKIESPESYYDINREYFLKNSNVSKNQLYKNFTNYQELQDSAVDFDGHQVFEDHAKDYEKVIEEDNTDSEDNFQEQIKEEYGRVFCQSRVIKTQEDLKQEINFDNNKYQVTKGYNKSAGISAKTKDGNNFIYNTNYYVSLEWRIRGLDKPDKNWTEKWLKEISRQVKLPKINVTAKKTDPVIVALGDLHVGALFEGDGLVPNYNKEVAKESLDYIASYVNQYYPDRNIYYLIGGDIIESFTGKNHRDTWKNIELHGAKAALEGFDLLYKLFTNTNNFYAASMISGNHDRGSENNQDDKQGQTTELLAGMFDRVTNIHVEFDPLFISKNISDVNFIIHHGDKRLSQKKGSQMVLDYGDSNFYNVIVGFHKHKFEVEEDTTRYRKITVPPIVKGTDFSKEIGSHSPAGFVVFEKSPSSFVNTNIVNF